VNNEIGTRARTKRIQNQPNELLGEDHGEWLDTRATGMASGGDTAMAAVEIINGTTKQER
jgi:hypothetical protein